MSLWHSAETGVKREAVGLYRGGVAEARHRSRVHHNSPHTLISQWSELVRDAEKKVAGWTRGNRQGRVSTSQAYELAPHTVCGTEAWFNPFLS